MKYLLFLMAGFVLISCKESSLKQKITGSDSLVVEFYVPNTDTISRTVQTTQKHAIDKMINFADTKETELHKCGYDGGIIFYSKGQRVLPILFKYKDASCRHFAFDLDGQLKNTKMKNEAADFLESLEAGKETY